MLPKKAVGSKKKKILLWAKEQWSWFALILFKLHEIW